jgi:hypothetical protein
MDTGVPPVFPQCVPERARMEAAVRVARSNGVRVMGRGGPGARKPLASADRTDLNDLVTRSAASSRCRERLNDSRSVVENLDCAAHARPRRSGAAESCETGRRGYGTGTSSTLFNSATHVSMRPI